MSAGNAADRRDFDIPPRRRPKIISTLWQAIWSR